jgi:hypothetical protein
MDNGISRANVVHILSADDAGFTWQLVRADNTILCESVTSFKNVDETVDNIIEVFAGIPKVYHDGDLLDVQMTTVEIEAALSLLTISTGEQWDIDKLRKQGKIIRQQARRCLMKMGVSKTEAGSIVEQRWASMAGPIPQSEPEHLPVGRPEPPGPPSAGEIRERARRWHDKADFG